jgi:SAM-dependent MidA family methyltransferase
MLPDLTADQARHSAAVARAVSAAIEAQAGWLAFDDYLRIVLYAPGLGYYSAGSVKFGPGGDFVTAPELSGLYARCLASQCAPVLRAVGGDVLELGAGTGRLAAGVLTRLAELEQLPHHYYILEVSADLRVRQSETLEGLPAALRSRVAWLDALPATPITGVVLANEVADALPFQRFVIDAEALYQRGVGLSDEAALVDADRPASAALRAELGAHGAKWLAAALSVRAVPDAGPLGRRHREITVARRGVSDRLWPAAPRVLPPTAQSRHLALSFSPSRA